MKLAKSLLDKFFIINNDIHDDVVFLWRQIAYIHNFLTQNNIQVQTETLFERIRKWLETFLGLETKGRFGSSRVTPYMRYLLYHVPSAGLCSISVVKA